VVLTETLFTLNENVAGSVSTTSEAVSVTFRNRLVSACPATYRLAAKGVAVVSAPVRHLPVAVQASQ